MKSLLFLFIFASFTTFSQNDKYVSFELGGVGGFGSFNYEQSFLQKPSFDMYFRAGLSFAPIDKNNGTAIVFPLLVHGQYGENAHRLDFGIGQAFTITTRGQMYVKMPASIGYRLQPLDKNYYLRFAYTPIFNYLFDFNVQHWGGITFGYKINKNS